jgi:hypothetical protein
MSTYRYKIRRNSFFFSGGTGSIDPMISTGNTGNQQFTEYLTTYRYKPGQQIKNSLTSLTYDSDYKVLSEQIETNPLFFSTNDKKSVVIASGTTINSELNYKNITIPINSSGMDTDNSDTLNKYIKKEAKKLFNPIKDGERVKYKSEASTEIRFYSYNSTDFYTSVGFQPSDFTKNNFKKSFFRLYFYDSNDVKTQNLLLTEDINISGSVESIFDFNRLFWLKSDDLFIDVNNSERIVYMTANFFNAKNGKVYRFINPPTTQSQPLDINVLNQNSEWLSVPVKIINPKTNGGKYQFKAVSDVGATNTFGDEITFTEYKLKTQ